MDKRPNFKTCGFTPSSLTKTVFINCKHKIPASVQQNGRCVRFINTFCGSAVHAIGTRYFSTFKFFFLHFQKFWMTSNRWWWRTPSPMQQHPAIIIESQLAMSNFEQLSKSGVEVPTEHQRSTLKFQPQEGFFDRNGARNLAYATHGRAQRVFCHKIAPSSLLSFLSVGRKEVCWQIGVRTMSGCTFPKQSRRVNSMRPYQTAITPSFAVGFCVRGDKPSALCGHS